MILNGQKNTQAKLETMKIKNILSIIGLTALIIANNSSFGQEGENSKLKKKEMMEQLELSEEQKNQIEEITALHKEKAQGIKSDESMSDEEKKNKIKELREENKAKVEGVLTVEQRDELKVLMAANKEQSNSPDDKAKAKTEKLKEALSLTESQSEEVLILNTKTINGLNEIRGNEGLSDKEKKDQAKLLKDEHKLEMETILNADQFKQYEELLTERKNLKFAKKQDKE